MAETPPQSRPSRPWLPPLLWCVVVVAGVAFLCWREPTAREVIGGTALTIFQVLTTPFIFELTLAIIGICAVITINQLRLDRDTDEWVQMHVPSADGKEPAGGDVELAAAGNDQAPGPRQTVS